MARHGAGFVEQSCEQADESDGDRSSWRGRKALSELGVKGGAADQRAGDYVIHNPLVVGTDVYVAWYSDGVRVVDASDATAPEEVAYFVPPATNDPVSPSQRGVLTNTPQVWGVAVDEATGLIYISDMNSGLWILRRTD